MATHSTCNAALIDALKQLRARWMQVRHTWRDDASAQFEKDFLEPLEPAVMRAVRAIDEAGQLMQRVKIECGDD